MEYKLTASVHKGTCSSAHLNHNRRKDVFLPHVDTYRTFLYNKCYIDMSLEDAYEKLFGEALREYNSKRKPCRQIKNYLEHIQKQFEEGERKYQEAKSTGASRKALAQIRSRRPVPFNEIIVSVANADLYEGAFRCGGSKEQLAVDILEEYMQSFQERNPHLFVFSAHLHRDETGNGGKDGLTSTGGVPHLHIDYICWTDEEGRGLPVRVSESGAFRQQNLVSENTYSTVLFQERERQILSEIARKHQVTIVEGKHSKKHISKEEFILQQEKEKAKADHELINNEASELIRLQDEFVSYVRSNGMEEAFAEHIENISLKRDVADLKRQSEQNKQFLAECWNEYNNFTSSFFATYRDNKNLLWEEIKQARKTSHLNKKRLESLIYDITQSSDFLIVKLFKLIIALCMAVENVHHDKELDRLQQANKVLKEQAKKVMAQSGDVSAVLRQRDIDGIETALAEYEKTLENTMAFISNITKQAGLVSVPENTR